MNCPVCNNPFTPNGRQTYCSNACKAVAYRRRRDINATTITIPKHIQRKPITIYECDTCGTRALGNQRCDNCGTFMQRIGIGGTCPHCEEPVAANELGITT